MLLRALLPMVLACAPKAPGEETEASTSSGPTEAGALTGESSTGSTTVEATTVPTTEVTEGEQEPVASCDCVAEGFGLKYVSRNECGWSTCGKIERECSSDANADFDCEFASQQQLDVEAVDCALAALVAGEPVYLEYYESPNGGYEYRSGLLKIGEGRTGLAQTWEGADAEQFYGAIEIVELREPDYFVGCQALVEPLERYLCLKDWTVGPPIEVCAPEQYHSDF